MYFIYVFYIFLHIFSQLFHFNKHGRNFFLRFLQPARVTSFAASRTVTATRIIIDATERKTAAMAVMRGTALVSYTQI